MHLPTAAWPHVTTDSSACAVHAQWSEADALCASCTTATLVCMRHCCHAAAALHDICIWFCHPARSWPGMRRRHGTSHSAATTCLPLMPGPQQSHVLQLTSVLNACERMHSKLPCARAEAQPEFVGWRGDSFDPEQVFNLDPAAVSSTRCAPAPDPTHLSAAQSWA